MVSYKKATPSLAAGSASREARARRPSSRGAGSTRPRADALLVHGRDRNYSLGSGCKYP